MTFRETTHAVLHYQPYDKIPVVSFGYWAETVQKWAAQGHITQEEADDYCRSGDNGAGDRAIMKKLGFDFNWNSCVGASVDLFPHFARQTLEVRPDGGRVERDENGLIVLVKPGVVSIPAESAETEGRRYGRRMCWHPVRRALLCAKQGGTAGISACP